MPQGRRKTPFSGKAKKTQIMMKREKKEESLAKDDYDHRREVNQSAEATASAAVPDRGGILMDVQLQGKSLKQRYELASSLNTRFGSF